MDRSLTLKYRGPDSDNLVRNFLNYLFNFVLYAINVQYIIFKIKFQVVELEPGSKIYVSSYQLNNTKDTSSDQKVLARNLLDCVFTETALQTCSLAGGAANNTKGPKGLHPKGVEAILGNNNSI